MEKYSGDCAINRLEEARQALTGVSLPPERAEEVLKELADISHLVSASAKPAACGEVEFSVRQAPGNWTGFRRVRLTPDPEAPGSPMERALQGCHRELEGLAKELGALQAVLGPALSPEVHEKPSLEAKGAPLPCASERVGQVRQLACSIAEQARFVSELRERVEV